MSEKTGITWCHSTFNPWWGCVKVSPGCDNCYAERDAHRYGHEVWGKDAPRRFFGEHHWNEPRRWNARALKSGQPWRVFCASMADIGEVNDQVVESRLRLWRLIHETPALTWLLLTKRPDTLRGFMPRANQHYPDWDLGWPNVWIGTTIESNSYLWRAHKSNLIPAVIHWLSVEPQIAPVDVRGLPAEWVVYGGESGPGARPYNLAWLRQGITDCRAGDKTIFVKQLGNVLAREMGLQSHKGMDPAEWPADIRIQDFPEVPRYDS